MHEGEFSGLLIQLIELMTMEGFKPHAERLKTELPDGDSTVFKTSKYLMITNFKDTDNCKPAPSQCSMFGSTKGLGSMLLAA
jgi:hypothetical protein